MPPESAPPRRFGSLIMTLQHSTLVLPLALLFYIYNNQLGGKVGPRIQISTGIVEGLSGTSRDGRQYFEFLGIPYARPPVGEFRFEPPKSPLMWEGVRLANEYGAQCNQIEFFTKKLLGQEDCLFLNVFMPKVDTKITNGKEPLLPVMVYIHGGYFMSGSANSYRPEYFMDEDIVLVTINYRVAALGFLNTGDGIVLGNMGLKDQVKALEWIQKNIVSFGGDPKKVTLFGNSAGAAGVHYHVVSPMSKGLFHKAISQSGTSFKVWSFVSQPAEQAKRLGKQLNCPTENTADMVSCMKALSANTITKAHSEYLSVFLDPLSIYAPSIEALNDENTFLAEHPLQILKKGKENRVPWVCGLSSHEGLLFTARIIENKVKTAQINNNFTETLPVLLAYNDHPRREQITKDVRKLYLGNKPDINFVRNFQNFTNMFSDRLYFTASHEAAILQRRNAPVLAYYYTYHSQFSFASLLQLTGRFPAILELGYDFVANWVHQNLLGQNVTRLGVSHGDELVMLFHIRILSNIKQGHKDYNMSKAIVKLWTDFASADSYDSLEFRNIKWQHVGSESKLKLLNLDTTPAIIDEPFTERVAFWKSFGLF